MALARRRRGEDCGPARANCAARSDRLRRALRCRSLFARSRFRAAERRSANGRVPSGVFGSSRAARAGRRVRFGGRRRRNRRYVRGRLRGEAWAERGADSRPSGARRKQQLRGAGLAPRRAEQRALAAHRRCGGGVGARAPRALRPGEHGRAVRRRKEAGRRPRRAERPPFPRSSRQQRGSRRGADSGGRCPRDSHRPPISHRGPLVCRLHRRRRDRRTGRGRLRDGTQRPHGRLQPMECDRNVRAAVLSALPLGAGFGGQAVPRAEQDRSKARPTGRLVLGKRLRSAPD